jgi:predicted nucleic acid-binding protein
MDVVVDASVIIAVIANEPEKEMLIRLTAGTQLIAPHSVHWEIGNAFSAMLRRKRTTPDIIAQALGVYQRIPIRFVDVELDASLEIADALGIYAYDAYLIRCAQKYSAPLISLDAGLVTSGKRLKVRVIEVNP